jgi:transposase
MSTTGNGQGSSARIGRPLGGYDVAFKRNAVALVEEEHRSITDVARELGVTTPTINTWRKQYGRPSGVKVVAPTTERGLREENALLRAEIARLHTREEILKKTLGILSEPPRSVIAGLKASKASTP